MPPVDLAPEDNGTSSAAGPAYYDRSALMIASPSTLRPLAVGRAILGVCANDAGDVAWVEQIERRFVVLRARRDGGPTKVADLVTAPSIAFAGDALHAAVHEGVVRLGRAGATPVHLLDARPREVILKGTETLLAIVGASTGRGWEILELGARARSVGTYDDRPLAVSTMGAVWVAAWHDESVEPIEGTSAPSDATATSHRGTWHLESDVAGGPEITCGRVRALVAIGTSDERVPGSRGGVLFVERRAEGDGIGEVWPDGSCYRYEARTTIIGAVAPLGDGMCWSEGHRVWRMDGEHDEPSLLLEVEPDVMVQSLFAVGASLLVVTSGGYGTATSLRWHDRDI